ncbi:MAG: hypothetical protein IJI44_01775 [Erysipelotrichaceae bacterium]|nr:hypothetical protein [Erysipelotrichaceae bacterium]
MKDLLKRILPVSKKAFANQMELLNRKLFETQTELTDIKKMLYYQLDQQKYPELLKQWYKDRTGNILDLDDPKTYNEKIQWLKLNDRDPRKTLLSDKYLVRDWIKGKIGEQYLIPLLGVYRNASEIDFSRFPDAFVLKANHGSGMNQIVRNKAETDLNQLRYQAEGWLRENFTFSEGFEMQYDDIPRRLLVEKYLNNNGRSLDDYKFWCFDGKCRFIEVIKDRGINIRMALYDTDWKRLPYSTGTYPLLDQDPTMPRQIPEMVCLAEKLAEGFPHVRVDLYLLDNGEIKFGEMTFSSSSGTCRWDPPEADLEVGKMLKLPLKRIKEVNI